MTGLQSVWGWQPALYLFLGGMGAGAFILTAVLYFQDRKTNAKVICVSAWAAAICLIVGLLLLLSELTNPMRGMLLWQSFSHWTSWMTFGAWAVFAAVIAFGLMALLSTEKFVGLFNKNGQSAGMTGGGFSAAEADGAAFVAAMPAGVDKARSVLSVIGILLGIVVAVYTGVLLMSAPGVPLWNTPVLPLLFTVSAFDTGIAMVEVITAASKSDVAEQSTLFMQRGVVALVVIEIVVLAVFIGLMPGIDPSTGVGACAQGSAAVLVSGDLALPFWGLVVVCGLAFPLAASAYLLIAKGQGSKTMLIPLIGAVGALAGGCALRFLVLAAGSHLDVVAQTVSLLF